MCQVKSLLVQNGFHLATHKDDKQMFFTTGPQIGNNALGTGKSKWCSSNIVQNLNQNKNI